MRVECAAEELDENDETGEGVRVTCGRCDHGVESRGTSGRSLRRCLALLREECPNGEENFYVCDGSDDD